jgi:hypothetical protein
MNAPTCPVSYSQIKPLPRTLVDLIHQVPRATDLQSLIAALNRLNYVLHHLAKAKPHVNNTINPRQPSVVLLGEDEIKPLTGRGWAEVERQYVKQRVSNPDDKNPKFIPGQHVDIQVITGVIWQANTGAGSVEYTPGFF